MSNSTLRNLTKTLIVTTVNLWVWLLKIIKILFIFFYNQGYMLEITILSLCTCNLINSWMSDFDWIAATWRQCKYNCFPFKVKHLTGTINSQNHFLDVFVVVVVYLLRFLCICMLKKYDFLKIISFYLNQILC